MKNIAMESNIISIVRKPQQIKATRVAVYGVCECFSRMGIPLTVNKIRNALGGGGFETIGRLRDEWVQTGGLVQKSEQTDNGTAKDSSRWKKGLVPLYLELGPVQDIADQCYLVRKDVASLFERLERHKNNAERLDRSLSQTNDRVLPLLEGLNRLVAEIPDGSETSEKAWIHAAKMARRLDEAAGRLEQVGGTIATTLLDLHKRLEALERRLAEELMFDEAVN